MMRELKKCSRVCAIILALTICFSGIPEISGYVKVIAAPDVGSIVYDINDPIYAETNEHLYQYKVTSTDPYEVSLNLLNPYRSDDQINFTIPGTITDSDGIEYAVTRIDARFPVSIESVIIGENVREIGNETFKDTVNLTNVKLPKTLEKIGDEAFINSGSFTLDISNTNVKYIGNSAFMASKINGLVFNDKLEAIGNEAFYSCIFLNGKLIIPESLIEIGDYAFAYDIGFDSLEFKGDNCLYLGKSAFSNCIGMRGVLEVPSVDNAYDSVFNNTGFDKIILNKFSGSNKFLKTLKPWSTIVLKENSSYILNTGCNGNYIYNDITNDSHKTAYGENCHVFETEIDTTNGHYANTKISDEGFIFKDDGFGNATIYGIVDIFKKDLIIPSTIKYQDNVYNVKVIDNYAFSENPLTGTLTIDEGLEKIGEGAFQNCFLINGDLTIPCSVKTIDSHAFYGCEIDGTLTVPDSVTTIGSYAFIGFHPNKIYNNSSCDLKSAGIDFDNFTYYSVTGGGNRPFRYTKVSSDEVKKGEYVLQKNFDDSYIISFDKDIYVTQDNSSEVIPVLTIREDDESYDINRHFDKSYQNNKTIGVATITITPKDFIVGNAIEKTFYIYGDISADTLTTINAIPDQVYTGAEIKPELSIKLNNSERVLVLGTDYDLEYTNNKNVGTASITIKGKNDFINERTITFNIIKADLSIYDIEQMPELPCNVTTEMLQTLFDELASKETSIGRYTLKNPSQVFTEGLNTVELIYTPKDTNYNINEITYIFEPKHIGGAEEKINEVAATCTSKGSYDAVIKCKYCGTELSCQHKETEMLEHVTGEPKEENRIDATCIADGGYDLVTYCDKCGTELSNEHVTIDKTGHTEGDWETVIEPTATQNGKKVKKCSKCYEVLEEETIPATGSSSGSSSGSGSGSSSGSSSGSGSSGGSSSGSVGGGSSSSGSGSSGTGSGSSSSGSGSSGSGTSGGSSSGNVGGGSSSSGSGNSGTGSGSSSSGSGSSGSGSSSSSGGSSSSGSSGGSSSGSVGGGSSSSGSGNSGTGSGSSSSGSGSSSAGSGSSSGSNSGSGSGSNSSTGTGTTTETKTELKVGDIITDASSNAKYKVTKLGKKKNTVEYISYEGKSKKVTVPATITAEGITFKVTTFAASAFKGNKKLTMVTLGNNITKIRKASFTECVGLKKLVIKSEKLTTKNVTKNVLKSIPTTCKVYVPASMKDNYSELFVSKGLSKKVKIYTIK